MHEKRNFILVILLTCGVLWSGYEWWYTGDEGFTFFRVVAPLITLGLGAWLTYALTLENPVTLHLAMPKACKDSGSLQRTWRQELLFTT